MRRLLYIVLFCASTMIANAAWAQDHDIVKSCDFNGNGIIDENEVDAIARKTTDPILREFDLNCDGVLSRSERAVREDAIRRQRIEVARALRFKIQSQGRGVPVEEAKDHLNLSKPTTFALPFLVRDAYTPYSMLNPPKPRDRAEGAQVSYTRDFANG